MRIFASFGIAVFCLVTVSCSNAAKTTDNSMLNTVHSVCPKADIINVEHKYESIEVEFVCNNNRMSMLFDKTGNVLYTETPLAPEHLLIEKIRKKVYKNHSGWLIDEISLIETPDTSFVKVEVVKNGVEESLFFTTEGKNYKFSYNGMEQWSRKSLSKATFVKKWDYDFCNPFKTIELQEALKEISGIAVVGDTLVFCVQDELGIVFSVDLQDETMTNVGRFTDVGDFEDVEIIGNNVVALRSDGTLFTFDYVNNSSNVKTTMINVPCMNMEGLFFDETMQKYLVACKEPSMGRFQQLTKKQKKQMVAANEEKERFIYTVTDKTMDNPEVLFAVKIEDIREFTNKNYNVEVQTFNPSAVAIHPKTGEVYVLSAVQRMIAVYNAGTLTNVFLLPPELFYKPEGLDFLTNGDMVISSEGMKKGVLQGQVSILKYKK